MLSLLLKCIFLTDFNKVEVGGNTNMQFSRFNPAHATSNSTKIDQLDSFPKWKEAGVMVVFAFQAKLLGGFFFFFWCNHRYLWEQLPKFGGCIP